MGPDLIPLMEVVAECVAREWHEGQVDRSGRPYLEHVLAVAGSPLLETSEQRQAAFLHDVLEDTGCTRGTLEAEGFSDAVVAAVLALTHRPGEPRREYIDRIRTNPDALRVKLADNRHNLSRNSDLPPGVDRDRLYAKYTREWEWLNEEIA